MDAVQDAGMDERLTVAEAASRLGITKEAIRKRISRGTLRADRDADGTVRVYVPPSETASPTVSEDRAELVEVLRDEIAHLRRESERKDAIIMSLSQANAEMSRTIRAIEAPASPTETPREPRESPTAGAEEPERAEPRPARLGPRGEESSPLEGTQRPWWRRMFGQ
jgi:excisionase family DNA binding protein